MATVAVRKAHPTQARKAARVLSPFKRAREYAHGNFDTLIKRYPEQWIAVHDGRVVAHHASRSVIENKLTAHQRRHAYTTFLTRKKQTLIL